MLIRANKTPTGPITDWGRVTTSHVSQQRKIPHWVDCDAAEFERMLNAGELKPCTEEEWNRIKQILHMSG